MLNDAAVLVRRIAAPWAAVVTLTSLPAVVLWILFWSELFELGSDASHYTGSLLKLSAALGAAALLQSWGRMVFVHACRVSRDEERIAGYAAFRLPLAGTFDYLVLALLIELAQYALLPAVVTIPILAIFSGLAAGASTLFKEPGLIRSLRLLARFTAKSRIIAAASAVLALGILLCWINLFVFSRAAISLAATVGLIDRASWAAVFSPSNPFLLMVLFGASLLAVQPFWLAANVVHVDQLRDAESGDDLRVWFREISREIDQTSREIAS